MTRLKFRRVGYPWQSVDHELGFEVEDDIQECLLEGVA
jgi:hypothetical protein